MAVRDSPSGSAGNAVPPAPCPRHRFGRPHRLPAAALPPPPPSPPAGACLGRAPSTGLAGGSRPPRVPQPRGPLRPTGRRGHSGPAASGAPGGPALRSWRWAFVGLLGPGPARGYGPCPLHAAPWQQVQARGDGACQATAGRPGLLTPHGVGSCVPGAVSPHADPCELARPLPAQWERACVPAVPRAGAPSLKPMCAPLRARPALSGYTGRGRRELVEHSSLSPRRQQGVGSSNDQQCLTGEALAG